MTAAALAVFAVCAAVVLWVYLGYPLFLLALARRRPRPVVAAPFAAGVTAIVPAHDEAAVIAGKVENLLGQEDLPGPLEVIVASDGSTDATEEIVRQLAARHATVRLLALPRLGKAAALDRAAAAARGEILVLTDANTRLAPGALAALLAPFGDPEVGGVCGNKRLRPPPGADATAGGEGLYWRFDQALKALESRIGSVFAADGALYAIRRELYVPIADPAQADDIAISARVPLQGRRLVFAPTAVAWEEAPPEGRAELRRKIRVTNHSVRALLHLGSGLWRHGLYSLELVSHKLLRHLVPWFLLPLFAAHVALALRSPTFAVLLVPHVGLYALAVAGFLLRRTRAGRSRLLTVPYFFMLANLGAFLGVLSILRGERRAQWSPRRGLER